MDKISGIIPASARTRTADVAVAQPARPGAPALGRPMGKNSLGDRVILSKKLEELRAAGVTPESQVAQDPAPVYTNNPEAKKLKVIQDLNQKFFNNPKSVAREGDLTKSEEALGKTTENESLFVVEPEMRPQASMQPVTEVSDKK